MLTILHAADFHLDAPFHALSAALATGRRAESRALLTHLAELAETKRADLVLLSGDLFDLDGARIFSETIEALARALGQIPAPVFIAPGNHDFYNARSPYATAAWPRNVHIFSTEAVTSVDLPALNCTVHGAAFTSPLRDDDPLAGFTAPDDGKTHVMALHGDVGARSRYAPIAPESIARSNLAYLALGHVHAYSGPQRTGNTVWAYPGCLEGHGFDELGEKGALCVTIDGDVSVEFVPLCGRKYEILEVDVSDKLPESALLAALPRDAQGDSYRILLTGETGVDGPDLPALTALAAPYFYSVSLRDQTRVRRDIWSRAAENTLTGHFLRAMRERIDAAAPEERAALEQAVRYGMAALENREVPLP